MTKTKTNSKTTDSLTIEEKILEKIDNLPESFEEVITLIQQNSSKLSPSTLKTLLQLIDETLKELEKDDLRLILVKKVGKLFLKEKDIYPITIKILKRIYRDEEKVNTLIKLFNLPNYRNKGEIFWEKVNNIETVIKIKKGTPIFFKDKGEGKIEEVNLKLGTFKIDFGKKGTLNLGISLVNKIEILQPTHILYLKLKNPTLIKELAAKDKTTLLKKLFKSFDHPLTMQEIKSVLSDVLTPQEINEVVKNMQKSPQLIKIPGSPRKYKWQDETKDKVQELVEKFSSLSTKEKEDAIKIYKGDKEFISKVIPILKGALKSSSPIEKINTLLLLYSLEKKIEEKDLQFLYTNFTELFGKIASKNLQKQAIELIRKNFDDSVEIFFTTILKESTQKTLETLYPYVSQNKTKKLQFLEYIIARYSKYPQLFTWVIENLTQEEYIKSNASDIIVKTIKACGDPAFVFYRKKLTSLLSPGGSVALLINAVDEKDAAELFQIIKNSPFIENYLKKPLLESIRLRYPEIIKEETDKFYATGESINAKKEELQKILQHEIPKTRKAIEEARALGDLRENFEYKSARQRYEYLTSLADHLNSQLSEVVEIEIDKINTSQASVGTKIYLSSTDNPKEEITITILGPWESDPEKGIISYKSDIAKAILGKKVGETLLWKDKVWKITRIAKYNE